MGVIVPKPKLSSQPYKRRYLAHVAMRPWQWGPSVWMVAVREAEVRSERLRNRDGICLAQVGLDKGVASGNC